jgi:hypothetical protein
MTINQSLKTKNFWILKSTSNMCFM